jgi:hypothetical protein
MGPTAATVLRDVLVSGPREVIYAIDVSPVPSSG